jgi:GTP-binding protein YchF
METVEKRIDRASKLAKGDKKYLAEEDAFKKVRTALEAGKAARSVELSDEEKELIKDAFLLTMKPILYVANIAEEDIGKPDNEYVKKVKEYAKNENAEAISLCAKIEEELSVLEGNDKKEMLEAMGLQESGLDKVIRASYDLLGLMSFLTAGKKEVRAWTINKGTKAPKAAGKIHSDIERGFIKAEIVSFKDLMEVGSYQLVKEKGLVRMEGKEYVMQDGDIVDFKFNV